MDSLEGEQNTRTVTLEKKEKKFLEHDFLESLLKILTVQCSSTSFISELHNNNGCI